MVMMMSEQNGFESQLFIESLEPTQVAELVAELVTVTNT